MAMSKYATKIKKYYEQVKWSLEWVCDAYAKGRITAEELYEITGIDVSDEGEGDDETYDFTGMTPAEVWRSLSPRPKLDEYRQACDWLGLEWDMSMTRAQLRALLAEACGVEE